jgi:hypothetical protein
MTNRQAVPGVFAALLATALALSPAATAGLASAGADTRMRFSICHFGGFRSVIGRLSAESCLKLRCAVADRGRDKMGGGKDPPPAATIAAKDEPPLGARP